MKYKLDELVLYKGKKYRILGKLKEEYFEDYKERAYHYLLQNLSEPEDIEALNFGKETPFEIYEFSENLKLDLRKKDGKYIPSTVCFFYLESRIQPMPVSVNYIEDLNDNS